ncbi:hypothetical protein GCM10011611_02340 [Aliidongia dinghuensis]|uniref:Uncharacterized protein n=1 Tax=Aliidongia dinghuensis TaxID=1867774 RepID=A0A8J2YPH1_9PROT|nr:hypothetical protein [Aliidongia dinghuensis]GGF00255.1 hypothetical protein GCM10011611_02340 [Aliidongia dinghuensis]
MRSGSTKKRRDLEREARLIEAGREAIRQGRYVADRDLDAWLDGPDRDPDLEIPLATPPKSDTC